MEYVYVGLLLHKLGKPITEANVKKVLEAAGAHVDETRVKALVASLDGVDINKAIEESALMAQPVATEAKHAEKKEEKKEEKANEQQAAAGLGALFG